MPLLKGKANVGKNIAEMQASGYPHKQALAAALSTALDKHKKKKPEPKR